MTIDTKEFRQRLEDVNGANIDSPRWHQVVNLLIASIEAKLAAARADALPETLPDDVLRYAMECSGRNNPDGARLVRSIYHFIREALATQAAPTPAPTATTLCPRCQGSGEGKMLVGGGPDAYEIDSNCAECGGIGEIAAPTQALADRVVEWSAAYAAPRVSEQDERAQFEAWGREHFNYGFEPEQRVSGLDESEYSHEGTQMAWEGWQARAALAHSAQAAQLVADWPACNEGCDYETPAGGFEDCRNEHCSCEPAKASIARQRAAQGSGVQADRIGVNDEFSKAALAYAKAYKANQGATCAYRQLVRVARQRAASPAPSAELAPIYQARQEQSWEWTDISYDVYYFVAPERRRIVYAGTAPAQVAQTDEDGYGETEHGFTFAGVHMEEGDKRLAAMIVKALGTAHPAMDDFVSLLFRARPAQAAQVSRGEPEGWRAFIENCSRCDGGMVNGNRLAIVAKELLAAAPIAPSQPRPYYGQDFLNWNRQQPEPPVKIGKELDVAQAAFELLTKKGGA